MSARKPADTSCSQDDKPVARVAAGPLEGPRADADLAAFARAVSHPVRVRILRMLARKHARMCSHIVDELPLAQSTVSEHLRILRSAGLVKANAKGPRAGYCIVPPALKRFQALLDAM